MMRPLKQRLHHHQAALLPPPCPYPNSRTLPPAMHSSPFFNSHMSVPTGRKPHDAEHAESRPSSASHRIEQLSAHPPPHRPLPSSAIVISLQGLHKRVTLTCGDSCVSLLTFGCTMQVGCSTATGLFRVAHVN
jgi:hypothetical protein